MRSLHRDPTADAYEKKEVGVCKSCVSFFRVKGRKQCGKQIPPSLMARCDFYVERIIKNPVKTSESMAAAKLAAESFFAINPNQSGETEQGVWPPVA